MAGRRRGTQLLTSIRRAVEAQLASAGSHSQTLPQLTSPYSDLLQPQQLTCLRHFSTGSTPLFRTTTSVAEVIVRSQLGRFCIQCSPCIQRQKGSKSSQAQLVLYCLQAVASGSAKSGAKPPRKPRASSKVLLSSLAKLHGNACMT